MGHHYLQEATADHTSLMPTQKASRIAHLELQTEGLSPDTQDKHLWPEEHSLRESSLDFPGESSGRIINTPKGLYPEWPRVHFYEDSLSSLEDALEMPKCFQGREWKASCTIQSPLQAAQASESLPIP